MVPSHTQNACAGGAVTVIRFARVVLRAGDAVFFLAADFFTGVFFWAAVFLLVVFDRLVVAVFLVVFFVGIKNG